MNRGAQSFDPKVADGSKPFSRPFVVDDVPDEGTQAEIVATPEENQAVAAAIGVPSVADLAAKVRLDWRPGRRLVVTGDVKARVTQVCVVSLEPFESEASQEIEITFLETQIPRAPRLPRAKENRGAERRQAIAAAPPPPALAEGEDDPPDPIIDGRIDLGAVAVEFLTLALDFYPRKPGVEFHDVVIGGADDPKPSAFAVLERLKDRS